MTLIAAGAIALDGRICRPGWLQTAGPHIHDCRAGIPPRPANLDLPDAVVVPGFVEMHVHGGGGASYTDGSSAGILRAAEFHRRQGTTTTLASLVTAPPGDLLTAVDALAKSTRAGTVAGIHLEGPWLSPARCGAQDRDQLRDPEPAEIDALLAAGGGAIRMVT
ncbi:MAG: amidohydrolase family protein, partial [Mycobacterium sp.]